MTFSTSRRRALSLPLAITISLILTAQALGAAWPSPVVLGSNGSILGGSPVFAATGSDSGVVTYAERDQAAGFSRLYTRRTSDGGITWTAAERISGYWEAGYPAIAAWGQRVYVVWLEDGIRYRRSVDGGVTWKPTKRLAPWRRMIWPSIAAGPGGKVALSWAEWDTGRVRIRVSKDRGRIFSPADTIGSNSGESRSAVAYGDGVLYVAWWASRNTLKFRRSTNDARSWKSTVRMATDGNATQQLSLAANGANAVLAFGGYDVRSRATSDGGKNWSPPNVVGTGSNNGGVVVAHREGAWDLAYATGTIGTGSAFYRSSVDGVSWSAPDEVTSGDYPSPTGVGHLAAHPLVFYEGADHRAEVRRGP